ncbi:DUF4382 domain-containing protein [Flavobacterium wongokense]|uniref:DUF4382 domain-containing protein n=1 Tax=Flavobacterium wongokense TaxID=2910674 RepID=UPI001F419F6C|nr:DUF4382 domain-containing protein [Flavobacterium sp. WG47]MCF6132497.1 DUF4382 domain-containing protein [Flavobacterium sp. WG47]
MKKLIFIAAVIVVGLSFNACSSDSNDSGKYAYKVRMTDAPGPYDEVNIDLQAVEVIGSNGQTITLNTTAGIYNLLTLSNGISTMIATSEMGDVKASQIRLLLGNNNTVKLNGIVYPLSTPSADQSGLKINVTQTLLENVENEILIDFDANTSIVETGAGVYKLKPVLRTIVASTSGIILGRINSVGTKAVIMATSSSNVEYSTNVNAAGMFQMAGLPAGTYTVTATPAFPGQAVTQQNVVVTNSTTTNIGAINL